MAEDWETPQPYTSGYTTGPASGAGGWGAAPVPPAPEMAAAYALRPLSLGEVLDRTFTVYRSHFWLFAGLASISALWGLILNLLQLLAHHQMLTHYGFKTASVEAQGSGLLIMLLTLPVSAVVYAASVLALCEVYLGREVDAKAALRAMKTRWLRYVGISVWWGFSALWVFGLFFLPALVILLIPGAHGYAWLAGLAMLLGFFAGGVYGVIAYIRNSLAIPAAVMEQSGVRASMRRSKTLAAGTKGRIFVVLLIAVALYMVAITVESPLLFIIGRHPMEEHVLAQAIVLGVSVVASTLISPVALIGLTLVYFDQRVRKEAFDILMLLGPEPAVTAPVYSQPAAVMPSEEIAPKRADDEILP